MRSARWESRRAGLLVPVFALRHERDFGIGDTTAVKEAIDFCSDCGFAFLQILPIHETVGDQSPYNPISSRALSPSLLTISEEAVPGLDWSAVASAAPEPWLQQLREGRVKYGSVQPLKLQLLLAAYHGFRERIRETDLERDFQHFKKEEKDWLEPYTLYRQLVREYEGNPNWSEWRPDHQSPTKARAWLERHPERWRLEQAREAFAYVQWVAFRQWDEVRTYAESKGVGIMGEMSFGVSRASADVWAHEDLFDRNWNLGTPPLKFFDTTADSERWGQNWGLPPYRWENHRAEGFAWLRGRVACEARFFHLCRLDHLRGYFRMYQFPWRGGAEHAQFAQLSEDEAKERTGGRLPRFIPGPDADPVAARLNDAQGRELLSTIREAAGEMFLVAEIMGRVPSYVDQALEDLSIASLAFPQIELSADPKTRPAKPFRELSLATYANHDNAPLAALYAHWRSMPEEVGREELDTLLRFAGWSGEEPEDLNDQLLAAWQKALFEAPSRLAVLMSSDLFGNRQRFNLPGSFGRETWSERLEFRLSEYRSHLVYGPRIAAAKRLLQQAGRSPAPVIGSAASSV